MTTADHGHRHGRSCYWDHLRCGWVCAVPPVASSVEDTDAGLDRAVDVADGAGIAAQVPAEPMHA